VTPNPFLSSLDEAVTLERGVVQRLKLYIIGSASIKDADKRQQVLIDESFPNALEGSVRSSNGRLSALRAATSVHELKEILLC
jgi:hypothetical protein